MPRSSASNQTKRKRELAKKDKRAAKDEKRARRKAEARAVRAVGDTAAPRAAPATAKVSTSPLKTAALIRWMNKTP
jgi:hypothetical protein